MKKILIALAAAAMMFSSCETEENLGPAALKVLPETLEFTLDGETQTLALKATRDWTVTLEGKNVEGITVTPMSGKGSNDPITVTVEAAKNEGYNRNLKIVFTSGAMEAQVAVKQPGALGAAISDVYSLAEGDEISVQGLVIAAHERGCIIEDETGKALVFAKNATTAYTEVGTTIKVTGKIQIHNGNSQIIPATDDATFDPTTFVQKTDDTKVDVPFPTDAVVVTKDNYSDIDWNSFEAIVMTGFVSLSGENNKYININFGHTEATGSVQYPAESLGFASLAGKNVEVKGYAVGISSGKYPSILVVSVQEKAAEMTVTPIEKIFTDEVENGSSVLVEGKVVAINQQNYLVKDETGVISVYVGSNAYLKEDFPAVGNNLSIIAKKNAKDGYMTSLQDATITENDNSTTTPTYGEPTDITSTLDAEAAKPLTVPVYVKVEGVLGGNYSDELTVTGQTAKAKVYYKIDDYTGLKNKEVIFLGYITGIKEGDLQITVSSVDSKTSYLEAKGVSVDATVTSVEVKVAAYGSAKDWTYTFVDGKPAWVTADAKEGDSIKLTLAANEAEVGRTVQIKISATGIEDVVIDVFQALAIKADATIIEVDFTKSATYPTGFPTKKDDALTESGTYTFGGYEFVLKANGDNGKYFAYLSSSYLMLYKGGEVTFPAVADKKLVVVGLTNTTGASVSVTAKIVDASGEVVTGGEELPLNVKGVLYSWYPTGTSANTSYKVRFNNTNTQIAKLKLIYQ